eukprot:scaffold128_cov248-Pinguiococcus_pyrenoidosus.AAC.9
MGWLGYRATPPALRGPKLAPECFELDEEAWLTPESQCGAYRPRTTKPPLPPKVFLRRCSKYETQKAGGTAPGCAEKSFLQLFSRAATRGLALALAARFCLREPPWPTITSAADFSRGASVMKSNGSRVSDVLPLAERER